MCFLSFYLIPFNFTVELSTIKTTIYYQSHAKNITAYKIKREIEVFYFFPIIIGTQLLSSPWGVYECLSYGVLIGCQKVHCTMVTSFKMSVSPALYYI